MRLGSLGVQIVLKSENAKAKTYFSKYKERDKKTRIDYLQNLRKLNVQDGIYLIDIARNPELLNDLHL